MKSFACHMQPFLIDCGPMNRRQFLETSTVSLALATASTGAVDFTTMKKRVGVIGVGWYGK